MEPKLITAKELAERCGVKERTIYRWMNDGCPHHKLGGVTRFVFDDVLEWSATQKTPEDAA